jgi:hypothetical protein
VVPWRTLQEHWRDRLVFASGWTSKLVNDKEVHEMNEATQKVALKEQSRSEGTRSYIARAFAAGSPTSGLTTATILRREPGPEDVQIEILYCGVCHSDLHRRAGKASRSFRIRVDHGPPEPLRFADWRHTRNSGDARLLRGAQHHCRRRSDPDPENQRSLRQTAEVGCEVPLLNRQGFTQITKESKEQ